MIGKRLNNINKREYELYRAKGEYYRKRKQEGIENFRKITGGTYGKGNTLPDMGSSEKGSTGV